MPPDTAAIKPVTSATTAKVIDSALKACSYSPPR
jgi:hypothetical protein